ncbi:LuxR C-terminal-related transcriptional regulator [Brevibacillus reuszeri]|uniref:LuxR C-terminal-related transcriptional regulator n=1 Tax=Brevibacillus reuszeri TaxID=54915 RepID=UPI003D1C3A85
MNLHIETAKRKVIALTKRHSSSQEFRVALLDLLRSFFTIDAACCSAVDPQTLLSTGAVTEDGVEAIHHRLFENEYLSDDFNRYTQLAASSEPVAVLSQATGGELVRSARYLDVLYPAGFTDELRAALKYDGACWGYLTLFRKGDQSFFNEEERELIASIGPLIAYHLRKTSLSLPADEHEWINDGPGIAVLSAALQVLSANAIAEQWLILLRKWESIDEQTLPRPIRAVCSRALSEHSSPSGQTSMAKVCIRMPDGPYLALQASLMHVESDIIHIAVWFEPAKPADMLPLVSEAYGLSEREKQILEGLVRGFSTKELANTYHISAYTVQDHLKSIFVKTGVTSRRELIWQLFSRFGVQAEK